MSIFLDTSTLLDLQDKVFQTNEVFYISDITIRELEDIKTASYKDESIKYKARNILRLLEKNQDKYIITIYDNDNENFLQKKELPLTNDNKILSCVFYTATIFITSDLACKYLATTLGIEAYLTSEYFQQEKDEYTGYKIVNLSEKELADFYTNYGQNINQFNLLENEYLIINMDNKPVAKYKWANNQYNEIPFIKFESKMFGKIVPKDMDIYQHLAMDSLINNQITMLRGAAGTGKSYIALGYMFSLLEKGKIDKIIIFCNTVATKGSAKLGYYPGSRDEKLLDSQIGNLLTSKLGDKYQVEKMVDEGQIVLLPMSDIRGYDTTGMNAAVYIIEAQNLDIELMRLALQRIGEDSICIIDGDDCTQVDMDLYAGRNNGMKRVLKIFKGNDFFGTIKLQNIKRSRIAELAQQL